MNDYIVTIDDKKFSIDILNKKEALVDGKVYPYELSQVSEYLYLLRLNNKVYSITTNRLKADKYGILIDGHYYEPTVRSGIMEKANEYLSNKEKLSHHLIFKAPMPGLIVQYKKQVGETVELGESLIVLEAMKMENDLKSPVSGIIKEIYVSEKSPVEKDQKILLIE